MNSLYGIFLSMGAAPVLASIIVVLALGFLGAPFVLWAIALLAIAVGFKAPVAVLAVIGVIAVVGAIKPIRRIVISSAVMGIMKKLGVVPKISDTERAALDAGVVWVEADLFSGKPNFKKMLKEPYPELSPEEQAFIDGPTTELCKMIDDWEITKRKALTPEIWDFIKKEKFLGMIIPKQYGGLEFSALAHGAVIQMLSARSIPAAISVMVPNSLGPGELLAHFGTDEQKKYYLPRLADGLEIPCFALTEPTAGSDAAAMTSHGELFKGDDGKLYIKLNWNKRYITLAAISTILGLAFKLRDPQNLLGKGEDIGITCALIPTDTPGVVIGRRHDPLGVPFYNCPTQGNDVVISVDQVIGGVERVGKGWGMLMDSLAAGRGISLPSQSVGGVKLCYRGVGGYAAFRKQFGMAVGKFEGIQQPLSKIGAYSYILDAARVYTAGAIDGGIKPPVVTAMLKYYSTEMVREAVNHGMDIIGGSGISQGPRNFLANGYKAQPIGITVEGANILTRTLIIFGQGALRAHPFAYPEVKALEEGNLVDFDKAFWGHIGHIVRNGFRALLLSVTRGYLAPSPVGGEVARYYRKMAWASASYAFMADLAMGSLGGQLKVKQRLTGRYADILAWMYLGFSVLRKFEAEGRKKEDLPFVKYSMQHAFTEMQKAFDGIYENLPVPGMKWLFKGPIRFWSGLNALSRSVEDSVSTQIAVAMQEDTEQRNRHTAGIFVSDNANDNLGRIDQAFKAVKAAESIEKKIKKAIRAKQLPKKRIPQVMDEAKEKAIITSEEYKMLQRAEELRLDAVQVDDFSPEEYFDGPAPAELSNNDDKKTSSNGSFPRKELA